MPVLEVVAAGAGACMIAGAVVWRNVRLGRTRRDLRLALADPRPTVRVAAVYTAATGGLARHAQDLLERCDQERDDSVIRALVEVITRNQWEPTDTPALAALRLWAYEHVDGSHRGGADVVAPASPAVPAPPEDVTPALLDVDVRTRELLREIEAIVGQSVQSFEMHTADGEVSLARSRLAS